MPSHHFPQSGWALVAPKVTGARRPLWGAEKAWWALPWLCLGGTGPPTKHPLPHMLLSSFAFLALSLSRHICPMPSDLMRTWPPSRVPLSPASLLFPSPPHLRGIMCLSGKPTSGASRQTPTKASRSRSKGPSSRMPSQLLEQLTTLVLAAGDCSLHRGASVDLPSSTGNETWWVLCEHQWGDRELGL